MISKKRMDVGNVIHHRRLALLKNVKIHMDEKRLFSWPQKFEAWALIKEVYLGTLIEQRCKLSPKTRS